MYELEFRIGEVLQKRASDMGRAADARGA